MKFIMVVYLDFLVIFLRFSVSPVTECVISLDMRVTYSASMAELLGGTNLVTALAVFCRAVLRVLEYPPVSVCRSAGRCLVVSPI
jgi:hypothetical protein